jgi:RHS repeat-associated protein
VVPVQGTAVVVAWSFELPSECWNETTSSWTVSFHRGADPITESGDLDNWSRHMYASGMRIAKVVGSTTYCYHTDALGSTWRMTDAAKATVFSTSYEPFGRSWGTTGSLAGTERYRFLGERNDTESGLTYLRARQYDSSTGRFTSMDPVLGALSMPQTLNP